ncbi:magnesium/cobalt transporter CorA [Paenibacillus spiritus]|uniref:Magnesium transport protein CorA n=1 Tax=Paenibacillus spiritus TaxID=2496557 RepID=A0A5J5FU97_9BACL|nr:magnesium/cobalt transporter CorA [Paenibacillus spiritus]KAA8996846.1 magnesium/cobalt transporter CorA [Paenibacillus spiritus]
MIRTLAITHEGRVQTGLNLEQTRLGDYAWIWADFSEPVPEETRLLDTCFHFHPLAIEDCLHVLQRPKLDYYEEVQFFVLHALNEATLQAEEVDLFLGPSLLVSFHLQRQAGIDEAWEQVIRSIEHREGWSGTPVAAAYTVIDKLVDRYFPTLYAIEDELAELENKGAEEAVNTLLAQVFDVRSRLLKLRRTIVPMRDLMYRVVNSTHVQQNREERIYFGDIHDHLLKLADMIEADREMTADLRDSYISLNSNRMNTIMKTLTVITTIFMPLTLIAGIYGMNFEVLPELKWRYGYFAVLGLMLLLGGGMILTFKRRGWFK